MNVKTSVLSALLLAALHSGAVHAATDPSEMDVVCMVTGVYNCSIDGKDVEDNDLPKYLPLLEEKDVKAQGGSCESVPLCYNKNMRLLGLNKKFFSN